MDIAVSTPTAPVPADSNPGQIACAPGGVARNVAENLARLGHDTRLVSAVGDDVFGHSLHQATAAAGVDVSGLVVLPFQRTASYMSMHGADGDMAVAVNDMGILDALTPALLQAHAATLHKASCLVLDCNLSDAALACLLEAAATVPVLVDGVSVAKCPRILPWLHCLQTLKVNRIEAQLLSGMAVHGVQDACAAALQLHRLGVREVVVSLGGQGVCWCDAQGTTGYRPASPVSVVSTSGAGDALLAGLVHGFLQHWPLAEAVDFAAACAEITLGSPRANHPDLSLHAVHLQRGKHSLQS